MLALCSYDAALMYFVIVFCVRLLVFVLRVPCVVSNVLLVCCLVFFLRRYNVVRLFFFTESCVFVFP